MAFLLENQAVNVSPPPNQIESDGAVKNITVSGTFDGATVTLQGTTDNGSTWITLKKTDGSDASFTTNTIEKIDVLKIGSFVGAIVSGAGGSTLVSAFIN